MSLEMITSFLQPNGTMPKSAFTVVKKPNNEVEMITTSEDKAVQASVEHIRDLVVLHERVAAQGMSRAVVEELQRIAPSAVPNGYGLEAFTIIPTNVMMDAGLEAIAGTVLAALKKLIKFLIEKLKGGVNILIDSYKVLTGISPSAYKLAKQQVYNEAMVKNWKSIMQTDLDQAVLEALNDSAINEPAATLVLDGFWNDASDICDNLMAFEPIVSQLQRATEDMMVEAALQQDKYNRIYDTVLKGGVTDEQYWDYAQRIAGMMDQPAFMKISKLLDQLAKKVLDNKLYKADDKTGKSIVDRLRSDKFRDVLAGLQEATRATKPLVLKPTEAFIAAQNQDFDKLVNQLKSFSPVDVKSAREYRTQLDRLRVYNDNVSSGATREEGYEEMCTKYLSQQNDIKAVIDLVRNLTAQYAETIFKMTAFRDRIRKVTVVKMVANTPEEIAMEKQEERMDELRACIRDWINKAGNA